MTSCEKRVSSSTPKLVSIFMPGAPSRWTFDLFLNPEGKNINLNKNPCIANRYEQHLGVYQKAYYEIQYAKEIKSYVPNLWHEPLIKQQTPAYTLLQNMISIQGVNTGNGAHFAAQRSYFGFREKRRLLELNTNSNPFSGINLMPEMSGLNSRGSRSFIDLLETSHDETLLPHSLLDPFKNIETIPDLTEPTLTKVNQILKNKSIDQLWKNKIKKYTTLVRESIQYGSQRLKGVTDQKISAQHKNDRRFCFGGANRFSHYDDLRKMIHEDYTVPEKMIEHFAFIEFVFELELTDVINIRPKELIHLRNSKGMTSPHNTHSFDEHAYGVMNSTLLNSVYNFVFVNCLGNLITFLKKNDLYKSTHILVGSEFNRSPRLDMSGSDHGWNAASIMILSGQVTNGPLFIGSTKESTDAQYPGYWGQGTTNYYTDSQKPLPEIKRQHVHATVDLLINHQNTSTHKNDNLIDLTKNKSGEVFLKSRLKRT